MELRQKAEQSHPNPNQGSHTNMLENLWVFTLKTGFDWSGDTCAAFATHRMFHNAGGSLSDADKKMTPKLPVRRSNLPKRRCPEFRQNSDRTASDVLLQLFSTRHNSFLWWWKNVEKIDPRLETTKKQISPPSRVPWVVPWDKPLPFTALHQRPANEQE